MPAGVTARPATAADEAAVESVAEAAWRATYGDLLEESVMADLSTWLWEEIPTGPVRPSNRRHLTPRLNQVRVLVLAVADRLRHHLGHFDRDGVELGSKTEGVTIPERGRS